MRAWLKAAAITYGLVFRRITAAGTIEGRLTGERISVLPAIPTLHQAVSSMG